MTSVMILSGSLQAQMLRIGPGGGLNMIKTPDYYTKEAPAGLGFSDELALGLKAKFSVPLLPLRITGQAFYTKLKSESDANIAGKNYNIGYSSSIFSLGVGAEMSLLPGPVSPYLGVDLLINSFGELKVDSGNEVVGQFSNSTDGFSRFGLGLGAGVEFTLLPKVDIDVSAKYNLNNMIGKESGEENINSLQISGTLLFGIF